MPSPSGRCGWELSSSASFSPFYSLADVDSTDAAFRILNHCRRMVYSTSNAVRAAQSNRLDGAPIDRPALVFVVYEAVEVLDFCGPFEVFSVTRLNEEKRREEPSPFNVSLIAEATSPVVATGGMKVVPDYDLDTCPQLDILIIPGGWGAIRKMNNERLVNWIGRRSRQVDTVTSVCTGALLLGKAGLLDGKRATTHWRFLDRMQELVPKVTVDRQVHFVEEEGLFSSAGISAGIDMSLRVVARYFGEAVARATARHMEYPFPENDKRRITIS